MGNPIRSSSIQFLRIESQTGGYFTLDDLSATPQGGNNGNPIPEPGTLLLMFAGLAGLWRFRKPVCFK